MTAPAWLPAVEGLDALQRAAEAAALLRGAQRSGLLARLAAPSGEDELAAELGVPPSRVAAALGVLANHGVVARDGDRWRLTDSWAPLVLGGTPLRFDALLGLSRVRAEQFEAALSGGEDYWQLDPDDRMLVARGISPDPTAAAAMPAVTDVSTMTGVEDALRGGGRLLELGCGIASRLCAMLLAFPAARGTGLELDPVLVEAARAQAERVGVADRLEVVCVDATTYVPQEPVDLVQWSQFFFPGPTRAAALRVAHDALRPGGWVTLPALWDGTDHPGDSVKGRALAADRLLLDLWQVPLRSAPELAEDLAAAGFTEVKVEVRPVMCQVRGRRPR